METKFSVKQISDIAKQVRIYKSLEVTTRGQMFRNKIDAEEAVRTLNMIIDDTNEHVGILTVTEDMMSVDKLKMFGKNPAIFDALFSKAKIPVSKTKKPEHVRNVEVPSKLDKKIVDEVEEALKADAKPADVKKTDVKPTDAQKADVKK